METTWRFPGVDRGWGIGDLKKVLERGYVVKLVGGRRFVGNHGPFHFFGG